MSARMSPGAVVAAALLPLALAVLPAPARGQTSPWKPLVTWNTYLGGGTLPDGGVDPGPKTDNLESVDTNADDEVFVTGQTNSASFPADGDLPVANSTTRDVFVTKLSADGKRLVWSRVFGGTADDSGNRVAVDRSSGDVYVVGSTQSSSFRVSTTTPAINTVGTAYQDNSDAYLARLTADGELRWVLYLGGTGAEQGFDLALGANHKVYVSGQTTSSSTFPKMLDPSGELANAFVTQVDVSSPESPVVNWTRLIGSHGEDAAYAVVADENAVYLGGRVSTSVVLLPGGTSVNSSFQGEPFDGFVAKLRTDGAIEWFSYVGGNNDDEVRDVLVAKGLISVVGNTRSSNFPTDEGGDDVFVSRVNANGTLGKGLRVGAGASEVSDGHAAVDARGNIFIGGKTTSASDFALNAFDDSIDTTADAISDGFVVMVDAELTPIWASYVGGSNTEAEWVRGLSAGKNGRLTLAGHSNAPNVLLPAPGHDPAANGGEDGFILRVEVDTSAPETGTVEASAAGGRVTASWRGFSDAQTGVVEYEWALGTSEQGEEVRPFQPASGTSAVADLPLRPDTRYYVTVRATNRVGLSTLATSAPFSPPDVGPGPGTGEMPGEGGGEGEGEILSPLGWGCGTGGGSGGGLLSALALAVLASRRRPRA